MADILIWAFIAAIAVPFLALIIALAMGQTDD